MKRVAILLFFLLAQTSMADAPGDIDARVDALNKQSIAILGVSFNALRFLVAAKEDTWLPLATLRQTGEYQFIEELENAGYARVVERDGLPNGYDRSNRYVSVTPRGQGREIQASLLALKSGATDSLAAPGSVQ